ncbi:MAG: ATP-binding protein [Myxococcales bacterium]|nr:ATP-binding protein [Myxococcales bacterium]
MSHAHLVVGPVGAGKSTFAAQLCRHHRASVLNLDEWMAALFSPDRPVTRRLPWYAARVGRCVDQIAELADTILGAGSDVVLEVGLLRAEERASFFGRLDARAHAFTLYVLDAPEAARRARVAKRNVEQGSTFVMTVSPDGFDLANHAWEPLAEVETEGRDVVWLDSSRPIAVPTAAVRPQWSRADPGNASHPPLVISDPAQGVLTCVTTDDIDEATATAYGATVARHVTRMDQRTEPWFALLDASHKSFVSLAAQRAFSGGQLAAFDGANIAGCAVVSTQWAFDHPPRPGMTMFRERIPAWQHCGGEGAMWPAVALLAGSTGAGKTTIAHWALATHAAIPFSIDDWLARLFGDDKPVDASFDWYMERIGRVEALLMVLGAQLLAAGACITLDLGLSTRAHRAKFSAWAKSVGATSWIVYADADPDERWQRVQQRNEDRGATWRLDVTRGMFDFMESRFEPPTEQEGRVIWMS